MRLKRFLLLLLISMSVITYSFGQKARTQFNGFGHLEYSLKGGHPTQSFFALGEHDFFVSSALTNRISFLGEYVIRFSGSSSTSYLPSIERSFIKFNYYKNHNIIAGKIHTPVNYWNDVYHHGRLFFPVIDRPTAFNHLLPVHTLGLQFQGQNIGEQNFGYDLVVGNGVGSTDAFSADIKPTITAAIHFKPVEGMRVGASYNYDHIENGARGVHSGHADPSLTHYTGPLYRGLVHFSLLNSSFAYFTDKFEVLNEFTYNKTETDSLGTANNFANFFYVAAKIKSKHVPYLLVDYMNVKENDLHTYGYLVKKVALGYRHEFSHLVNLKLQAEYQESIGHNATSSHTLKHQLGLKVQLAYGF